jgi:acylphosphatase
LTIARRVVVHGRVQGVFFRETARRRARRAGVSGWVRNNDDGSAYVERVDVENVEPQDLRGFDVR